MYLKVQMQELFWSGGFHGIQSIPGPDSDVKIVSIFSTFPGVCGISMPVGQAFHRHKIHVH